MTPQTQTINGKTFDAAGDPINAPQNQGSVWGAVGQKLTNLFGTGGTTTPSVSQPQGNASGNPAFYGISGGKQQSAAPVSSFTPKITQPYVAPTQTINGKTYDANGDPTNAPTRPPVQTAKSSSSGNPSPNPSQSVNGAMQGALGGLTPEQIDAANNPQQNSDQTGGPNQPTGVLPVGGQTEGNPSAVGNNVVGGSQTNPDGSPNPYGSAPMGRFDQINALTQAAQTAGNITPEEQATREQIAENQASLGLGLAKIAGNPEGMQLQTGQSNVLQQQGLAKGNLLTSQLANLQAQRTASLQSNQQALQGAESIQGYQQPVGVAPGQALVNPITGQQVGGNGSLAQLQGGGTGGGFINDLAQSVVSGQTSYADAISQLPSGAMSPALFQAIRGINPNFSITSSNQNADARGSALQQNATTVRPMVNSQQTAISHLDNLQSILQKVNYGNTPILNSLQEGWSNYVQSDPNIKQLQSEIQIIRGEVAKVLGGGTTTVESLNEAQSVVPDKISPDQFEQVKGNIEQLMQSKIEQYTNLNNIQQFPQGNQGSQSVPQSTQQNNSLYSF